MNTKDRDRDHRQRNSLKRLLVANTPQNGCSRPVHKGPTQSSMYAYGEKIKGRDRYENPIPRR